MDGTENDRLLLGTFEEKSLVKVEEGRENCSKPKAEGVLSEETVAELNVGEKS